MCGGFGFRYVAIEFTAHCADKCGEIVGEGMNAFAEKGVHFCSKHKDDSKVIKEKEQDHGESHLACVIAERISHIEREESQEKHQSYGSNKRAGPAVVPANVLVGDNEV